MPITGRQLKATSKETGPVSWTLLMKPNMTLGPNLKVMREEGAMKAYIKLVSALRANDAAGRSTEAELQSK